MAKLNSLLSVGCGGHARSLIELIESTSLWDTIGLVGLDSEVGTQVLDYQVIGIDKDLPSLRLEYPNALLGIGQLPKPILRQKLSATLAEFKFYCPIIISPKSVVSRHSIIGLGSTIGHGAIINAGPSWATLHHK